MIHLSIFFSYVISDSTFYHEMKPPQLYPLATPQKAVNTKTTRRPSILFSTLASTLLPPMAPEFVHNKAVTTDVMPTNVTADDSSQIAAILIICFVIMAFLLGIITAVLVYLLRKIRNR